MERLLDLRRLLVTTLQVVHFLIAFGFLCFGITEFVSNPPYFDGYGDAKASQEQLPKGLFQVQCRTRLNKAASLVEIVARKNLTRSFLQRLINCSIGI